ncbi:MAG: type II toxin-antitoxin system VapC family toxin [Patescibacteria group bacterium]
MVILDSTVWIAYLDTKDFRHTKVHSLYHSLQDEILIPEYVMSEVCSVLASKNKKETADAFIEIAESNADIEILPSSPQFFKDVRVAFQKLRSKHFSFVDVSLMVLSSLYPVITLDVKLDKFLKKKISNIALKRIDA